MQRRTCLARVQQVLAGLSGQPAIACVAALVVAPQDPAAGPGHLLVVTPAAFHGALQPLLEHKRQGGLAATAVDLATALATAGADDAERLKRFLFAQRQQDPDLRYVLLVGDADVMPVRFMVLDRVHPPAFDFAFYPSDLYYADLCRRDGSFDDWNATTVGYHRDYFGEVRGEQNKRDPINFDGVDYLPEIAVGRWPVSTVAEVERLVRKTIAFETWVADGGGRSVALLGVPGWIECRPLLQAASEHAPAGWRVQRLWWQDQGQADAAVLPPTAAHVQQLLNDGLGLLLHAGHGSEHGFDQSFGTRDLAALQNQSRPTILLSIGCTTARLCTLPPYEAYVDSGGVTHRGTNAGEVFTAPPPPPAVYQRDAHNPTSFGEQSLRGGDGGAVAYIGCDTGGQPCAATLLSAFAEAVGDPAQARLGDAWNHALAEYHRRERLPELAADDGWYPPSIFFQGMKYLLLGDPSLRWPTRDAAAPAGTAR